MDPSLKNQQNSSVLVDSEDQAFQNLVQVCKQLDLDTEQLNGRTKDTLVMLLAHLLVKLEPLLAQESELEEVY